MTTRLETPGLCQYDVRVEIAEGADPDAIRRAGGDDMSEVPRDQVPGLAQSDVRAEQAAAAGRASAPQADQPAGDSLDNLTKDQLLEEAERRGVEVKTSASKAEILDALRG
jgi:hypothetical protein